VVQNPGTADRETLLLQKLPRTPRISGVSAHCMLRAVAGLGGWPGVVAALSAAQVAALRPPDAAAPPARLATPADDALFAVLARDGRASHAALSAATGWSETTVRRRLDDLRRAGMLYFDVDTPSDLFGYRAEAALWLTVAPSALTAVTRALSTHPQIAFAAAVTGPANVSAAVVCRDLDELYDYLAEGVGALPGVLSAETTPLVRRVKGAGALLTP